MSDAERAPSPSAAPPIAVEGPSGRIRLKWHKLRTDLREAPFKLSNLALGWRLGASLEVDVIAAADGRLMILHDPTLGPSTTGRGRVPMMTAAAMTGLFHRDGTGKADGDAPVLSLADLMAHLKGLRRGKGTNLQLDLKILEGHPLQDASVADATGAAAEFGDAIVVGSHHLEEARRIAAAIPGARLGYDPMLAASRDPGLARNPERMLRHMERRSEGVTLAYLRYDAVIAAEKADFPLVRRLLDLGIETDAWTVNPGPAVTNAVLHALATAGVRQITTDSAETIAGRIRNLQADARSRRSASASK